MSKNTIISRVLTAVVLGALLATPALAVVAPNPASLLSQKNVLVINGTETSGDHRNARVALATKLTQLQTTVGFTMTQVAGSSPPTTGLDAYDIIFFNYWFNNQNSSAAFQNAFKAWVNSTNKMRGWLGVHTSGANEFNEWNWLRDSVTSMLYVVHSSSAQLGTVRKTQDPVILNHPIMEALPDTFRAVDEWYEFSYGPTWSGPHGVKVMYNLDESTLTSPLEHPMNPHPMAWYRENHLGNRFFYTGMIHNAAGVNSTAGNDFFTSMTLRALEYLAGYTTTSIYLNGRGVYSHQKGNVQLIRRGEGLKVEAEGPYRVEVRTLQGRVLHRAAGKGNATFRPEALRKSGMYVVRISTPSGQYSQRIMVQ
jgi:hypothetical protein